MAIKRKIQARAKAPAIRRPSTAPLDAVRNPNFDAAMAQRNYDNFIAEQRARMGAERGQSGNQDFIDSRDPNKMYTQDMVDYIDPATGERTSRTRGVVPAPGSRFVPANQAGGLAYNQIPPQGPQAGGGFQDVIDSRRKIYDDLIARRGQQPDLPSLMPIGKFSPEEMQNLSPERRRALEERLSGQYQNPANRGMGERMPTPIPEGSQVGVGGFGDTARRLEQLGQLPYQQPFDPNAPSLMPIQTPGSNAQGAMASQYQNPQGAQAAMADYNKMLQQGMQRNQDMNQAAQNFAGMGGPQRSFSQVVGGIRRMNRTPRQPRPNVIPLPKTRTI
jgi:hypothetical protein